MSQEQWFFKKLRDNLFSGSLKQSQVEGINILLEASASLPLEQRAYVFATVYHETARTMQPIEEYGKGKNRAYGTWQTNSKGEQYCYRNGMKTQVYTQAEYPHLYYGRGFVQLTWLENYQRATVQLQSKLPENVDLAQQPHLACRIDLAAHIAVCGMVQGWFTGKKLSDYINSNKKDYHNARGIINAIDKADTIARYAVQFEQALKELEK